MAATWLLGKRPNDGTTKDSQNSTFLYTQPSTPEEQSSTDPFHDKPSREDGTLSRIAHNWWLWELASCLFSIGCITAIAGVLMRFDAHPLPSWPYGITLNTLISLLAVVAKSAMLVVVASCIGQLRWNWFTRARSLADFELFDAASRGPGGAAWLLLRTLPTHLVTLAGVIMVAALAFEPFVQQVVSYGSQQVPALSIEATASRAQAYDNGRTGEFGSGGPQTGPESGMKAAVYQGLFGAVSDGPTPSCGTGNCSFPDFTSLAVCSQCIDVTEQTLHKSTRALNVSSTGFVYRYNVTYELPGGVSQSIVYGAYTDLDPPDLSYGPAMASKTDIGTEATKELFNVSQPIVAMSMLQFPYVDKEGYGGRYASGRPTAFECALYFCMQTYKSHVSNGKTETEVLASYHNSTLQAIDSGVSGTFDIDLTQIPGPMYGLQDSTFTVPVGTISTLSNWLNNTFAGEELVRISVVSAGTYVNDVLQLFSEAEDIRALFANVSISMSNYIRSVALADSSSTVIGTAYRTEAFVHVHWKWFILPVALLALTCVLFVATVVVSVKRGMQVWKSNSLAILHHGLAPGMQEAEVRSISQMSASAKVNVVSLDRLDSEGGLRLTSGKR